LEQDVVSGSRGDAPPRSDPPARRAPSPADELGEPLRAQRGLELLVLVSCGVVMLGVFGHGASDRGRYTVPTRAVSALPRPAAEPVPHTAGPSEADPEADFGMLT